MNENYVPFGEEWEKEMMNLKKTDLIVMLKNALIAKAQLENLGTPLRGEW